MHQQPPWATECPETDHWKPDWRPPTPLLALNMLLKPYPIPSKILVFCLSTRQEDLSFYVHLYQFIYLSVQLFYLLNYSSICASICLLFIFFPIHLSVYMFVWFICLLVCLFLCLSIYMYNCLSSIYLLSQLFTICLYGKDDIYIYPYICLTI